MIVHIVGARPQFIKLMPLWHALDALGAPQSVLHSGQHYESSMSAVFFEEFGIAPDGVLQWCSVHEDNIAAMSKTLEKWSPSTVVVYGDTFTTWCGARAARLCRAARTTHVKPPSVRRRLAANPPRWGRAPARGPFVLGGGWGPWDG